MKRWIVIAVLLLSVAAPGTVLAQVDVPALIAAARKGNPQAQNQLGVLYASGEGVAQDFVAARSWWSMAAGQELAGARYNLGMMYESGLGVTADPAAAARWYALAAGQGDAAARFRLGLLYENGRGVKKDDAQAFNLYRQAAEQGLADAQNSLGRLYELGRGGQRQNIAEARRWYKAAAEQGYVLAQSNYGFQLYAGAKTAPERIEAYAWLSLAANAGNAIAIAHHSELSRQLTPAQITAGEARATALRKQITGRQ
jgi:TPR repeat protein